MSIRNLEALFQPRSIAVIGASDRPGSVGSVVLRNLKGGGFKGPIWPVNPRHATVDAGPAWPDVASLPEIPDLAVICTPAHTVPDLVAELGRKGARAAIVMTAGLKQPASQGATLEQAMLAAARPYLLRILGPNCIGAAGARPRPEREFCAWQRAARKAGLCDSIGRVGYGHAGLGQRPRHRLLALHFARGQRRRRFRRFVGLSGQ